MDKAVGPPSSIHGRFDQRRLCLGTSADIEDMDAQLQSILEQELLTTVVMTETLKVCLNSTSKVCDIHPSDADQLPASHWCRSEIADGMEQDDGSTATVPR